MSQYPPGGAIFRRDKKTPQSPDMDGYVEIDEAMLSEIAMEIQQSPERKTRLNVAMWSKVGRSGKEFLSVKPRTETQRSREMGALGGGGGGQGGGGYQQPSGRPAPSHSPLDDDIPF